MMQGARVVTPRSNVGATFTVTKSAPFYTTVGEIKIEKDCPDRANPDAQSVAIPITIFFETVTAQVGGQGVQWRLEWGYGNVQFTRFPSAQFGRLTLVANWVRLSVAGLGAITTPGVVKGLIVPGADATLREATISQAFGSAALFNNGLLLTPFTDATPTPRPSTGPGTLWRLGGYNAGPNLVYVWVLDSNVVAVSGVTPLGGGNNNLVVGAVPSNGTFSVDLLGSGHDFLNGLNLVASSNPHTFTTDPAADLNGSYEMLIT